MPDIFFITPTHSIGTPQLLSVIIVKTLVTPRMPYRDGKQLEFTAVAL